MIIYKSKHTDWEIPPDRPTLDYFYANPTKYSYDGNILIDASKDDEVWILMDIPFISREGGILFQQLYITQLAFLMSQEHSGSFLTSSDFAKIYHKFESTSDAGIITPTQNIVLGLYSNSYVTKVPTYRAILSMSSIFKNEDFLNKIQTTFETFLKDIRMKVNRLPDQ